MWVDREAKLFVHLATDGGLDRGDHRPLTDRDVEQDLRAEPLDDLDDSFEAHLDGIRIVRDPHILGPDAERDLLAGIGAEPVGQRPRHPEADAVAAGPPVYSGTERHWNRTSDVAVGPVFKTGWAPPPTTLREMPTAGFEPARPFGHQLLRLMSLPISPPRLA